MKKTSIILSVFIIFLAVSAWSVINGLRTNEWKLADKILEKIEVPSFPGKTYHIEDFGARPNGQMNTIFIQNAIDRCSEDGGGKVEIPAGKFFTAALHLKSNVNLHLSPGAELVFSVDPADYLPLVKTRWEGIECMNYSPLIYAWGQENIAITGKGTLNGQADESNWWIWKGRTEFGWSEGMANQENKDGRPLLQQYDRDQTPPENRIMGENAFLRPQFINLNLCKNILLEDIVIKNAPFWIIHPVLSENITIRRVQAISHGPNNDGCDPESSKNILIENCFFDTGDDCIAIKSGRNNDGRRWNVPSENIIVRNCTMKNGHGGVVIGSEISGGARNVFVENCKMNSPELERAIRIKTNSNRGGIIENVYVRNIEIGEVKEAVLKINCEYDIKKEGTDHFIPLVRNIYLSGVQSKKSTYPIYLQGIKGEDCIDSVFLSDCSFKGVAREAYIKYAGHVEMKNVKINGKEVSPN